MGTVPRTTVRAFPEGVDGRVVGAVGYLEERLVAPLTGRTCAAWHVRVYGDTVNARGYVSCVEACDATTFTIADETGIAFVRADLVSLLLDPDLREAVGFFGQPSIELKRFLRKHAKKGARLMIDRSLRYEEAIIEEARVVAVVGRGRHEPDPESAEGDYRHAASRLVMTRDTEGEDILVSTYPAALK
jgi:hypothetical protein